MIDVITFINSAGPDNDFNGDDLEYVSHGVDTDTGNVVILPQVRPKDIGAKWDSDIGWYLPNK